MAERRLLPPGSTIGILGGGQLGRMLALAAAKLGYRCHIFCPDPASPAFDVACRHTVAAYEDETALASFVAGCDVVTYEFENVPAQTAAFLAARAPVYPDARALEVAQDRLTEKRFIAELGIPVPAFVAVDSQADLEQAVAEIGLPAVLKTRRFGYDGKGQAVLRDKADVAHALETIGSQPAILEAFVPFSKEISVILARNEAAEIKAYDPPENIHRNQILHQSRVPADIPAALSASAREIGSSIAQALNYVGVLAVELFVVETPEPHLLVNEIAPRVHNSGHWTMDACPVSQFEQHIRAVAGLPLGDTRRHSDVVMENLIGADVDAWPQLLAESGASLHFYGKTETRPGRKMGHVNRLV